MCFNSFTVFLGDPSVYGNLDVAKESVKAVVEAATSGRYNGYPSSIGKPLRLRNMNNIQL